MINENTTFLIGLTSDEWDLLLSYLDEDSDERIINLYNKIREQLY